MTTTSAIARRFLKDDQGATAVEYAVIVSMIAGAVATAVGLLGGSVSGAFQLFVTRFTAAMG